MNKTTTIVKRAKRLRQWRRHATIQSTLCYSYAEDLRTHRCWQNLFFCFFFFKLYFAVVSRLNHNAAVVRSFAVRCSLFVGRLLSYHLAVRFMVYSDVDYQFNWRWKKKKQRKTNKPYAQMHTLHKHLEHHKRDILTYQNSKKHDLFNSRFIIPFVQGSFFSRFFHVVSKTLQIKWKY